eukprot:1906948-Pleurochrysis_carterae.AAC.2
MIGPGYGTLMCPLSPPPPAPAQPRSWRDLPAGSTAKLAPLKTESGQAGLRAADASVLQPRCALETLQAEAAAAATVSAAPAVATVARLVAAPGYGDAAWAAIFSNTK